MVLGWCLFLFRTCKYGDVVLWDILCITLYCYLQKAHSGMASAMACSKDFLFTSFLGCIKVEYSLHANVCLCSINVLTCAGMGRYHSEGGSQDGDCLTVLGPSTGIRQETG